MEQQNRNGKTFTPKTKLTSFLCRMRCAILHSTLRSTRYEAREVSYAKKREQRIILIFPAYPVSTK